MPIDRRDFLKGSMAIAGGLILPAHLVGCQSGDDDTVYDVVVYGGTSAGVIAAVHAARSGRSVVLIEPTNHLGGLTTGGLGRTDLGVEDTIGGMSLDFYRRIRQYYQNEEIWQYQTWDEYMDRTYLLEEDSEGMFGFEPHVAKEIYRQMLEEAGVPVVMEDRLILNQSGVEKEGNRITTLVTEEGNRYRGRIFIDATYEGDLMAMAGVSYYVGRESNNRYDEYLNGVQLERSHNHIFHHPVDPYVTPGNPSSGTLPGVHDNDPGTTGEADHRVQAYCYRLCMTDVPENSRPIEKPVGYDEQRYELLFRYYETEYDEVPWINAAMPNRKTDINNRDAFSMDNIGKNYDYPEADYAERRRIIEEHEHYQKGLMWTLANHERVPRKVRDEVSKWGYAKDEFTNNGNWPPQLYIREARRMIGEYVMTEHDCRRMQVVDDSVGLGSYNMDSHNVQRYVTEEGHAQNEGNLEFSPEGPYAISYRSLIPKRNECTNLLVPCAVSASHISFGSIRMEPVFMLLGQSASAAADLALDANEVVQDVNYPDLRKRLLDEGQKLDVDLEEYPENPPDWI
ncbi:FAD-dependent oxidoreductase [Halalkalibaculum sp. DA3122]|uniref:FAD-dependent oxidoreductase n=1 Tax=Halalkalibaculum sp. DA3122 TaxID=3373607 RepID=UPI0037547228